jgi:hypothetical protein
MVLLEIVGGITKTLGKYLPSPVIRVSTVEHVYSEQSSLQCWNYLA